MQHALPATCSLLNARCIAVECSTIVLLDVVSVAVTA
jgi:hypothetical protein